MTEKLDKDSDFYYISAGMFDWFLLEHNSALAMTENYDFLANVKYNGNEPVAVNVPSSIACTIPALSIA